MQRHWENTSPSQEVPEATRHWEKGLEQTLPLSSQKEQTVLQML